VITLLLLFSANFGEAEQREQIRLPIQLLLNCLPQHRQVRLAAVSLFSI
jgi:hypothetical protein